MKHGWFIFVTGLVGAASGIITFIVTKWIFANLILRLATGGLMAVIVPIVIIAVFYPMLLSGDSEDQ